MLHQLMRLQSCWWLYKNCNCRASFKFSGFDSSGSSSMMRCASLRAAWIICPSLAMSAMCRLNAMPLCCVPSMSPGPRSLMSSSAIKNPSEVWVITSSRWRVEPAIFTCDMSMQYELSAPRPTRPRSWCNCDRPNRSAFSMSITVAFGTLTPTSMTVVATMIWAFPLANRCIWWSFSAGFIFPWTKHTR